MKRIGSLAWMTVLALPVTGAAYAADEAAARTGQPPTLKANPFSRPTDLASRRTPQPSSSGQPGAGGRELRAVLSGTGRGLANIGGELIETGALFGGYQLVRIERDTAIFIRGGEEIRLEIGEDLPDE